MIIIGVDPSNVNTCFMQQQDDIYEYPDLWVCLYDTYGCDAYEYEEQCVSSIFDTEGGSTTAVYRPGDPYESTINFTFELTEKVTWTSVFTVKCDIQCRTLMQTA